VTRASGTGSPGSTSIDSVIVLDDAAAAESFMLVASGPIVVAAASANAEAIAIAAPARRAHVVDLGSGTPLNPSVLEMSVIFRPILRSSLVSMCRPLNSFLDSFAIKGFS
jgi:hypothetical protein